ncbi:drug/metabolite exporter YedA [Candidatus Bathyarchaeota archaeon]|nr:MAG: drug/metabolite exporter YedA [Candidatus Bathyarchaeota archaeon]
MVYPIPSPRGVLGEASALPLLTLRLRIALAFLSIYTIWGSTYLAIRFAIETFPPFLMAAIRFLIAGGVLYAWMRLRGAPRPTRANWKAATIIGGFLLLGGNGGVTNAEQVIPSGLAAVLITTVPIWMALAELLRRDRIVPTLHVVLGLILGFGGVVLLVGGGDIAGSSGLNPLWAGVLILASLSWAIGSVYSRKASLPTAPLLGSGMEMLAGGVLLLVASLVSREWIGFQPSNISLLSLVSFLYLIIFGSLVGFSSYVWLLTKTTTARVSTYAYVNPVVAVLLGYFLAGEQLTIRTLLASSVIVIAVVVITTYKSRQTVPDDRESES